MWYTAIFLVFFIVVSIPLFINLGKPVVRIFDESRLAVSAYEMQRNGHLLVKYYEGNPDRWSTKPPLLTWIQAGLIKVMGPNERAIRLPSALAALITLLAILLFSVRILKSPFFGLIWAFVLVTSRGYVSLHGTRTGDYDAMLTLFMTLAWLFFFLYAESRDKKYIYFASIALSFAVLTKGIAGMLFLPGLLIFILFIPSGIKILLNRHVLLAAGLFLLLVGGYYISAEVSLPGYLKNVWDNEIGGRYLKTLEQHDEPFFYYLKQLYHRRLNTWFWALVPGLIVIFFTNDHKLRRLNLSAFILAFTFFLIISFSGTKLAWYDLPMYPLLALFVANFIHFTFTLLEKLYISFRFRSLILLPYILLVLIYFTPYRMIINKTVFAEEKGSDLKDHRIAYVLREGVAGKRNLDQYFIAHKGYNSHVLYYMEILRDIGQNINFKDWKQLAPADKVIAHQPEVKDYIESNFRFKTLEVQDNVVIYQILENHETFGNIGSDSGLQ